MKAERQADTTKHWNAGDAGCGRLILGVRREIGLLHAGEVLGVTARDPAAHIDLACWCHMTGHELVSADHPNYVLRKKSQ